jgi:hypothetical protein
MRRAIARGLVGAIASLSSATHAASAGDAPSAVPPCAAARTCATSGRHVGHEAAAAATRCDGDEGAPSATHAAAGSANAGGAAAAAGGGTTAVGSSVGEGREVKDAVTEPWGDGACGDGCVGVAMTAA